MLTFRFSGADGVMVQTEILTSGMVGKEVKLEFSKDWEGLAKTAVFKAGAVTGVVTGVSDVAVIPAQVLARPLQRLYVGVYGVSADGSVTPTIRAEGPDILPGVEPTRDQTTDPALPVWAQLDQRLTKLEQIDAEDENEPDVDIFSMKTIFANIMTILKAQVEDDSGTPQGYSMDISGLVDQNHALIAALGGSGNGGEDEPDTPVGPDEPAVPEVTLTGISAAYSGGSVPVGTAVTALTGIVVKAHYSDGSAETVTGYTLSGTIAEGGNTITVTYQGKTTTFTVTGVGESGGDPGTGVTSINWFIETRIPENNTIAAVGLKEPDNGYIVTTDTTHTASNATRPVLAWPLIRGKTYSVRISNTDANNQFFGLWVSTLNVTPVKGEITAVTDTIVQNLDAWGYAAGEGNKNYTYTAGSGEYLMINANTGNVLTITAEVTA